MAYEYIDITFDANGGTIEGQATITLTAYEGEPFWLPYPTSFPAGATEFLGWGFSYNQDAGLLSINYEYDLASVEGWGTTTLYAIYDYASTGSNYIVTFDPVGGTYLGTTASTQYSEDSPIVVPGPDPERDYYSFLGWVSSEGTIYIAGDTVNEHDTVLTAQWEASIYEITYELNGGYYSWGGDEFVYSIEDPKGLISPEKDGSTFEGWYTTSDFSGSQIYELHPSLGHVTLYAKWSEIYEPEPEPIIEVYFYPEGDDVENLPGTIQTTGYGVQIPDIVPSRPGYTFSNWALDTPEGYSVMPGDTLDCNEYGYTIYLYARWLPEVSNQINQVWIKTTEKWSKGLLFIKTGDTWKRGAPKININNNWD